MLHANASSRSLNSLTPISDGRSGGGNTLRPPSLRVNGTDSPAAERDRSTSRNRQDGDRYSPYSSRGAQPGNRLGSSTGAPASSIYESDRSAQALIEAIFKGRPPLPPQSTATATHGEMLSATARPRSFQQLPKNASSENVQQQKKAGKRIFSRKEEKDHQAQFGHGQALHRLQDAVGQVIHPHQHHHQQPASTPRLAGIVQNVMHNGNTDQYATIDQDLGLAPRTGDHEPVSAAIEHSPVKSWKTPLPQDLSPTKQKRREGAERAKLANGSRPSATRSSSTASLFKKPFSNGNRSSTSIISPPANLVTETTPKASGSASSSPTQSFFPNKTIRASMDSYDSTSSLSRLRTDGRESERSGSVVFRTPFATEERGTESSESQPTPSTSGRSSPTRAKSVKWDDDPHDEGKVEIDGILRDAERKRVDEERRGVRETMAHASRTSSRSSSRSRSGQT